MNITHFNYSAIDSCSGYGKPLTPENECLAVKVAPGLRSAQLEVVLCTARRENTGLGRLAVVADVLLRFPESIRFRALTRLRLRIVA
ncbi:MAG: hypothetical protein ACI9WU_004794 [Myxococcota bacterium]|jgi:hypothetical protein